MTGAHASTRSPDPMPSPRRNQGRRRTILALAGVMSIAICSAAQAQLSPDEVNGLFDQLASDSFAQREAATEQLISCEFDVEPLASIKLLEEDLTPEQLARLESILYLRFINAPRAALGVQFAGQPQANNQAQPAGVVIDRTVPGFPCDATLMPQDIIRVVDGKELTTSGPREQVQAAILSHLPGEELELIVERDGRRSFFRVPLGEFARLQSPMPTGRLLKAGWELRRARLGLASITPPPPIRYEALNHERAEFENLPKRNTPEIGAGGSPDNGAEYLHVLRSRASAMSKQQIAATNNKRVMVQQPQQRLAAQQAINKRTAKAQLGKLTTSLTDSENERERCLSIISRDDVGETQKQSSLIALAEVEARIASIKFQIREIKEAEKADGEDAPKD